MNAIATEEERWRHGAFPGVLIESVFVDRRGDRRIDADRADIGQAIGDRRHAGRAGRLRDIAQPGQRRHLQVRIVDQELVDPGELFGGDARKQIVGRPSPRPGAAGEAHPLQGVG
jgi:hypothetical protein